MNNPILYTYKSGSSSLYMFPRLFMAVAQLCEYIEENGKDKKTNK